MEYKFICLLVLGIASISGAEAQECVAWGDYCMDAGFTSLGSCCRGATCTPGFSGGFCMVDDSCIAGGYPCVDADFMSLGECCQGKVCMPVPGSSSGGGYCVSSEPAAAGKL